MVQQGGHTADISKTEALLLEIQHHGLDGTGATESIRVGDVGREKQD